MKKEILYIGNALSGKGSNVTSIETLGNFLIQEGYTVKRVSSKSNKILRLLDMFWTVIKYRKKVSFILIDTYSTTNFWYAVLIGRLSCFYKIDYIPILRGGDLPQRIKRTKKISKRLFGNARVNIVPSQYLMRAFNEEGYRNLKYIPNTIAIDNYTYKERFKVHPKLLWVRSFSKIYNPLMALKILEELLKKYPDANLCMVGPAKDESFEICTSYAEKYKLPVTFTGKLEKEEWITLSKDYDIFINTTNFDNTPVSVIEAMALGLPVVSTDVGGVPFLIKNGENGLLCEVNAVKEFISKIIQLIEEERVALNLAVNARNKVLSFDWNTVKTLWNEVLS